MAEQHLLSPGPLLNEHGNLNECGYAFSLVKRYDRSLIKASPLRIKEWDYYYIGNSENGLALTVADNGYMSMVSITVLTFGDHPKDTTKSIIGLFSKGKLGMPIDSRLGDVVFEDKKKGFSMRFLHQNNKRRLICYMENFNDAKETFRCDILLMETCPKSMVIVTPWEKPGRFYYNQKINNQLASGYAKVGETFYDFNKNSYGVLDWGRGVWTYKNTWYWASCSAKQNGHTIGFNLGYGFGSGGRASENMLFIDDMAYKLDDVKMDIPIAKSGKDDFMKPWIFRSSAGDINMTFTPVYNRHSDTNLLILRSNQNQVFGTYTGHICYGDNQEIVFSDLPGFAEKVYNRW